jgi:CHAT domain-containing protein/predicted Zn-dependent protease
MDTITPAVCVRIAFAMLVMARDEREQGKHAEAAASEDAALVILEQDGSPAEYARDLMGRATEMHKQGKHAETAAFLDVALSILKRFGTPAEYAICLMNLANALSELGKHADALAGYDAALSTLKQLGPPAEYARCLKGRANALREQGKHAEAVAGYDEALPLLRQHALSADYARRLTNRANALREQGKHAEAVAGYDEALPLLKQHGSPAEYARCLTNLAGALRRQGKYAEAVAGYDEALPLLRQSASSADYALCLTNRAGALQEQGKYAEAVAGFDEALPLLKQHGSPAHYILCLTFRAGALQEQGKYAEAVAAYHEVLPLLRQHALSADYARCLTNRAGALERQGKYAEAMAGYDEALPLLKQHGSPAEYALCLMNRASAMGGQGKYAEAVAGYDEALPLLMQHAPPAEYALCLTNRAGALERQGRHTEAVATCYDARRHLRRSRRRAGADDTNLEYHSKWAFMYQRAIKAGLAGGLSDATYDAVRDGKAGVADDLAFQLGRQTGSEPADIRTARDGLTRWMRTRVPKSPKGDPPAPAEKERYFAELGMFFAGCDERTRHYLSAWGQHVHAYDPARAAVPEVEDLPTRADIQDVLPDRWALIDFWRTGDDEFHAFVVFKDDFRVVKLPFSVGKNSKKLERLAESVRRITDEEPQLEALNDLYGYLFRPLLPLLREKGVEGLYLVPHDFLHLFPLHAALGGQKYLCDQFAVAYLPSANLLPRLPSLDTSGRPFVLANPEAGTDMTLPFSHWEALRLRKRLGVPDETFFLGRTGRYAATDRWADCGLVHFSCHGHGDEQFAPRSHLRLADDLLLAHDVLYRRPGLKQGALVVLNGCQTSVPDCRAVDQGMGLMTAFLLRGAGLVLSTQWSVMDLCAADMALTFVKEVSKPGVSPAAALKEAQRRLRATPPTAMRKRMRKVRTLFPAGSPEAGKVDAQLAWLCWRAGMFDEAVQAAEEAAPPLRAAGLGGEAEMLLDRTRHARSRKLPEWFQSTGFDSPVFWGAFQLVGRVT